MTPATLKAIRAALLLATLTGCLGAAPPIPRDHYYRVAVEPTSGVEAHFPGTISVAQIEAEGLLRERPLLFSSGGGNEVQQHDYHYWTEAPPRMLQTQLVDYLRRNGVAESVITPDLRLPADFQVTGNIRRFERVLLGDATKVVAEIELAMTDVRRRRLVVVQSYGAEVAAQDDSVESSVRALDDALGQIFARFVTDADSLSRAQRAAVSN